MVLFLGPLRLLSNHVNDVKPPPPTTRLLKDMLVHGKPTNPRQQLWVDVSWSLLEHNVESYRKG